MTDSNYCRHGSYIGDPYGPDYMCHACEMGYSDEEYCTQLWQMQRRILAALFLSNLRLRWACRVLAACRLAGVPLNAEQAAPLNQYTTNTTNA